LIDVVMTNEKRTEWKSRKFEQILRWSAKKKKKKIKQKICVCCSDCIFIFLFVFTSI
jgi:hypothetical protein